jgi:hypothetical protein
MSDAQPVSDLPADLAPRQPTLAVHVRVPIGILVEIDALIGARFADRSEAIRGLLYAGLRAHP